MDLLAELTRAQEWLRAMRPLPPDVVAELRHRFEVRLTHHSTAIEGNTLTQSETEIVLEKGVTIGGKSLIEHLEVIGHKEAMDFVLDLAESNSMLTEREVREIHSLVMKGQDAGDSGRYRTLDVKAAGTEYVYPSHLKVPELMTDFIGWLESNPQLHPVHLASEAHLRFVTIHPFRDGNGRVGRLLMNLLLIKNGYPIGVIDVTQRASYISSLEYAQANHDRVNLDQLIEQAVAKSMRETLETALSSTSVRVIDEHRTEILNWIQAKEL